MSASTQPATLSATTRALVGPVLLCSSACQLAKKLTAMVWDAAIETTSLDLGISPCASSRPLRSASRVLCAVLQRPLRPASG